MGAGRIPAGGDRCQRVAAATARRLTVVTAFPHLRAVKHERRKAIEPVIRDLMDSSRAYLDSAERTASGHLKQVFREIAERRAAFAAHLQTAVDGSAFPSTRFAGKLRRLWLAVRDHLSEDDYGLLAELERSEDVVLARYERALAPSDLPDSWRRVLRDQLAEVRETHDRVRKLRDGEKAARQM